jgi:fatty acid desaturase
MCSDLTSKGFQVRSTRWRRYSLTSPDVTAAVDSRLIDARWFRADVPRRRMKELMAREDFPAIRETAMWLGGLVVFGGLGVWFWGSWVALPFFLVYGVLYGSASDSRWHECGHGTPFRTRWMNNAVYNLASFFMMRQPTVWRWQHTRHHTDTLVAGRDPEIQVMRPARLARILMNFLGLFDVPVSLYLLGVHASGRLTAQEREYVPDTEIRKVARTARIWVLVYIATVAACVVTRSILPLVLVGGPRLYGTFMHMLFALTQHSGMGENVIDHRLNTRTVHMCRVNRFLYWNMNYHVEHHMFPMVPSHKLPELHAEIKDQLAPAYPSVWAAYKEIVPAVLRQLKDPTYYIRRELPAGAPPYQELGGDEARVGAVVE